MSAAIQVDGEFEDIDRSHFKCFADDFVGNFFIDYTLSPFVFCVGNGYVVISRIGKEGTLFRIL